MKSRRWIVSTRTIGKVCLHLLVVSGLRFVKFVYQMAQLKKMGPLLKAGFLAPGNFYLKLVGLLEWIMRSLLML